MQVKTYRVIEEETLMGSQYTIFILAFMGIAWIKAETCKPYISKDSIRDRVQKLREEEVCLVEFVLLDKDKKPYFTDEI